MGSLVCEAGGKCVYKVRNNGPETSYISYGNTAFPWGDAHFAGGGCIAAGQTITEVAYTHNGHGVQITPPSTLEQPFSLPYRPHDNRCPGS